MTTYTVTYVDAKGGGELTTFVEADGVEKDPHWVSFYTEEVRPDKYDPTAGCVCGARPIMRSGMPGKKKSVAFWPASRIRSVQVSQNVDN